MSACQCYKQPSITACSRLRFIRPDSRLFNWITAMLVTGWVAIVALAVKFAGAAGHLDAGEISTLDAFLRQIL